LSGQYAVLPGIVKITIRASKTRAAEGAADRKLGRLVGMFSATGNTRTSRPRPDTAKAAAGALGMLLLDAACHFLHFLATGGQKK
jgi:hypothetical protein